MILFGLFMPHRIFENSETLKARPFKTGWNGVLAFAMILGLMLVFALTGVGVILMPFFLLAAVIAARFWGDYGWIFIRQNCFGKYFWICAGSAE